MNNQTGAWMKRAWPVILILAVAVVLFAVLRPQSKQSVSAGLKDVLPTSVHYERANGPREFRFPSDSGPHPEFQTEWWYYTGSLTDGQGRQFGYQLTFFRRALAAPSEVNQRGSDWAASQVYLAHFTVSDIENEHFHFWEETARGAAGLAGAVGDPSFEVWLYDWKVEQTGERTYRLSAGQSGIELELDLEDEKGPILHGQQGYSRKGESTGNASYYISQTRLISKGHLRLDGETFEVSGTSWMDHEFSTSVLSGDQVGWDWFSIQLEDGREILVYTIRHADGTLDPYSYGSLILEDGSQKQLGSHNFLIETTGTWTSEISGTQYPSGWQVRIPEEKIDLEITPLMKDQELRVSYTYWEGAVRITGSWDSQPVSGRGYVELTGYAESMQGQF